MALITIQVLEGLERGRVYKDLRTPVTIGREDENAIQLNDERVSRFHAKIQEDGDDVILTDLESTNGTRVNGRPVQLRVLRPGDQVGIGRCLLVYGSQEEIQSLAAEPVTPPAGQTINRADLPSFVGEELLELFPDGPPLQPQDLTLVQRARLADVLSFVHDQVQQVLTGGLEEQSGRMMVSWHTWQQLVNLARHLAVYLGEVGDPEPPGENE